MCGYPSMVPGCEGASVACNMEKCSVYRVIFVEETDTYVTSL